jgi:predicted secreted acid phosphatase
MKQKSIICDLDGTLCDTSKRQHFVKTKPKDWLSFYRNIPYDEIHEWCYELIFAMFHRGYHIIFVSGRSEENREMTLEWLLEKLNEANMRMLRPSLFMRKAGDYRKDSIVKNEIYETYIKDKYDVLFCVDDRPSVCRMWRSIGLTVLQCNDVEF